MHDVASPAPAGSRERGCPAREPRLQAAAQPRARLLRELLGRVHVPLAHGGHLLAVRPGGRGRRPRLRLADLDPGDRDALRRARVRRAREPLPGGGGALPVQQVLGRPGVRLVRRLVLRDRAPDHRRRGRHRRRQLRHEPHPQLVRLEPEPGRPQHGPDHHGHPARDPDDAEHHRREGHGPRRPVRCLRRDRRHARDRDHPRDPRLPPRPRLPVLDPGSAARGEQRLRVRLPRQLDRGRAHRGAGAGLHLLRVRVGRRHLGGDKGSRVTRCRRRCAGRCSGAGSPRSS